MQAAQHQEIQNYLLWLQERGQCWPIVDTLTKMPQASPIEEVDPDKTIEIEPQAATLPKTQISPLLFRCAGSEQAPYLGIVDCVKGQKLVFGKERELLIKILSALGIDLKSQFRLLGLETDHRSAPFASYQEYQQQFLELVKTQRPKAVFCFGRMPYRIVMNDASPFPEKVNKPRQISAEARAIFPMYHLCELMHSPELKKQTWFGLKSFMKDF